MGSLLLDTHALLWSIGAPDKLSPRAKEAIVDGANVVYVSAASVWEIAIKRASGKLRAPDDLLDQIFEPGFLELPITAVHAERAGTLPPLHRDPFDRMLVAQASCERLTIVTTDARLAAYRQPTLW